MQWEIPGGKPDPVAVADEDPSQGDAGLLLEVREQWGLVPISTLEGGETRGRARQGIVSVFNPNKMLTPRSEAPQASLQFLVEPLHLAVGLGMVAREEAH